MRRAGRRLRARCRRGSARVDREPGRGAVRRFGHTRDEFEAVLGEFAKGASPHATEATWDGEVWLDFNAGTKLTNFTLDDAANTPVTVVDDGSGELTFR